MTPATLLLYAAAFGAGIAARDWCHLAGAILLRRRCKRWAQAVVIASVRRARQ